MKQLSRLARAGVLLAAFWASTASPLSGQEAPFPTQVVSANPFGLLLELFNAEYERAVSASSTAGFGGSYISTDREDYTNLDGFWRYYPGGQPLDGWAFGVKAGVTRIPDTGTFFGYGFDLNHSWIMGSGNNFYVGIGFGLKRLVGAGDEDLDLAVIPTIRIVNVGIAF